MSSFNNAFENFKEKFRKFSRKCIIPQGAIIFNKTCLNKGSYPKFVQINPLGKTVTDNENNWCYKIL